MVMLDVKQMDILDQFLVESFTNELVILATTYLCCAILDNGKGCFK